MVANSSNAMMDRLMGIITFKAPVYKAVAEDPTATAPAAGIVAVVALVTGIIGGTLRGGGLAGIIAGIILVLLDWLISAMVLAFVSKTFFQGRTDTNEMLRVTGFAQIFNLLSIIPIIGSILAFILLVVAYVIGIREAAEVSTTNAVLIAVITIVILVIISFIIGAIFGALGFAISML